MSAAEPPVLSQGVGYGVVCGLGIFFAILCVLVPPAWSPPSLNLPSHALGWSATSLGLLLCALG